MLFLNLNPILKARGIERAYTFLVKAGIPPNTASKIVDRSAPSFKLSHIEIICKALFCEPNDILQWVPDKDEILPESHPLQNLKQEETFENWEKTLATIPLGKLKELVKGMDS